MFEDNVYKVLKHINNDDNWTAEINYCTGANKWNITTM